jgi:hypothetical protein
MDNPMDNALSAIPALTARRGSRAAPPPKEAWRPNEWCTSAGCCKAQFYKILGELETVRVGRMRFVLTSPAAWLATKAAEQKSVTVSAAHPRQPQAVEVEAALRVGDNCGLCQRALRHSELTLSGRIGERLHIVGECCAGRLDQLLGFGIFLGRPASARELALELAQALARQLARDSAP